MQLVYTITTHIICQAKISNNSNYLFNAKNLVIFLKSNLSKRLTISLFADYKKAIPQIPASAPMPYSQ